MSYDIEVYGKLRLAPSEVQIGAGPVTANGIHGGGLVQAFTHDSGECCFIVDGPHEVGGEDMDSVPTGLPDNVRFQYAVIVEGSAQPHIGHALRFADEVAKAMGGVVHDPQVVVEETSDPRYVSRRTGPSRETFLHVEWFRRFDEQSPSLAQMYLESAKEHLPAALPTVFGVSEPLRGKLRQHSPSRDLSAPSRASSSSWRGARTASSRTPRSRSPASHRRWRCRNGVSGRGYRRALRG